MVRKRKTKDNETSDALAEALDGLDAVHTAIVKMALDADISPVEEDELTSVENDDLPGSTFTVGDMNSGPERGGGVVLDTRVTLELDSDQAEAIVFALMRQIRNGDDELELMLDGRFVIGAAAAKDFRRALREGT